jgi:hypothetical protein
MSPSRSLRAFRAAALALTVSSMAIFALYEALWARQMLHCVGVGEHFTSSPAEIAINAAILVVPWIILTLVQFLRRHTKAGLFDIWRGIIGAVSVWCVTQINLFHFTVPDKFFCNSVVFLQPLGLWFYVGFVLAAMSLIIGSYIVISDRLRGRVAIARKNQ